MTSRLRFRVFSGVKFLGAKIAVMALTIAATPVVWAGLASLDQTADADSTPPGTKSSGQPHRIVVLPRLVDASGIPLDERYQVPVPSGVDPIELLQARQGASSPRLAAPPARSTPPVHTRSRGS